jgi:hypothetical protein
VFNMQLLSSEALASAGTVAIALGLWSS